LAVANFITQGSDTGLHHVLLTLGNLYHIYSDSKLDEAVKNRILGSLEKRWAAADQDVFIAAVVMNPYIRKRWFASGVQALTPSGLLGIVKRVCARIFREEPDVEFSEAFMDYLQQREEFSDEWMQLGMWTDTFEKQVMSPSQSQYSRTNFFIQNREVNLVMIWEGIDTQIPTGQKQGRNRLTKLAIHILSIIANSAGCERVFSQMGLVQTKCRSRLGLDKVRKTALIRMDLKRRHVAEGLIRPRTKRTFDTMSSDLIQPSMPSILLPPNSEPTPSAAAAQPTQPPPSTEPPEINVGTLDVANFDDMAKELVQAATESDQLTREEQDADEDLSMVPPPNPPTQPSTSSRSTRPSTKTKIPLKNLFRYPTDPDAPAEGLNFYWKWGIKHLEEEMLVAELMTDSLEDIDETALMPSS
jgi:hypothetical protein